MSRKNTRKKICKHTYSENKICKNEMYENKTVGDLSIKVYGVNHNFTILGHTFHGLKDLKSMVEVSAWQACSELHLDTVEAKDCPLHVGEYYDNYPCFDSYDSLNEDRSYQNYIIRDKPITVEDMKNLFEVPSSCNEDRVHENVPMELLPIVYYDGYSRYIKVATKRTSNLFPQENKPIAQHTPSSKPKERSFVFGGNEYTKEVLLQSETITVFCKDEEDEVSYVKDKYGRFWLYCAHIRESHDSTLIYYSLVNSEEEARELAQNGDYFYRRKMPFFSWETKEDTLEFQIAVRRR